jgi:hypothetical protein
MMKKLPPTSTASLVRVRMGSFGTWKTGVSGRIRKVGIAKAILCRHHLDKEKREIYKKGKESTGKEKENW